MVGGQGPANPFRVAARPGSDDPQAQGSGEGWLDQVRAEGKAGQVGAAAAAGLVPDPVQVRADGADADVQVGGDLGVGPAPGDQDDQLPLPGAGRTMTAAGTAALSASVTPAAASLAQIRSALA
jgi:hypothetical protein